MFLMCCLFCLVSMISLDILSDTQNATTQLPLKTLKIGDKVIKVEIVRKPQDRRRGLMHRKSLPKNQGMLFEFSSEQILSFWMKNTWIPLSIGFFNAQRQLIEVQNMEPESILIQKPKTYQSSHPAKYALEMNKGWFIQNKIKIGTSFEYITSKK